MGNCNEKRGDITIKYKWLNHVYVHYAEWQNDSFLVENATIAEADKAFEAYHAKYKTEYVITGHIAEYSYE
jgi:TATA-binding protein-associated factor Taf7